MARTARDLKGNDFTRRHFSIQDSADAALADVTTTALDFGVAVFKKGCGFQREVSTVPRVAAAPAFLLEPPNLVQ